MVDRANKDLTDDDNEDDGAVKVSVYCHQHRPSFFQRHPPPRVMMMMMMMRRFCLFCQAAAAHDGEKNSIEKCGTICVCVCSLCSLDSVLFGFFCQLPTRKRLHSRWRSWVATEDFRQRHKNFVYFHTFCFLLSLSPTHFNYLNNSTQPIHHHQRTHPYHVCSSGLVRSGQPRIC